MANLETVRAVVFDMDGVLWRGNEVIPQAPEFLDYLRARGIPFVLATNNSGQAPRDYEDKLLRLGLGPVPLKHVITSGVVTIRYLKSHLPLGSSIYVVGGDGLHALVQEAGFVLSDTDVAAVVAGIDRQFTYEKAWRATRLIRAGALFIGTNPDKTFPMPDGPSPGAGSILAMLAAASGQEPLVMGKPAPHMFEAALDVLGTAPSETLMVGDRLDTDIVGARLAGLQTALVLTGIESRESILGNPDLGDALVVDDLAVLQEFLKAT
ncbi:MAG: HAD-IIA family hydrolase [Anaerolineae bacterium]